MMLPMQCILLRPDVLIIKAATQEMKRQSHRSQPSNYNTYHMFGLMTLFSYNVI